jgi:broad specificity phosphatase PhoE
MAGFRPDTMPGMLTIHLIRHGDTAQAADGIFCGDLDPPLTPHGLAQAELVGRSAAPLGLLALYCSPKLRARQTAAPLAMATGLEPTIEPGLREIAYGRWEGRKESEIRASEPEAYAAWHADPGMASPPGGETAFEIAARALPVVARVRDRHKTGHVALVSHKATVRILVSALLGMPLQRFRTHIACPTASITSFELGPEGALLIRLADIHHLA